jgi:hypothetical protein
MELLTSLIAVLLFALVSVNAHGSLKAIEVAGKQYLAWQIRKDDYVNPPPLRYARRVLNEGPVKDFTGKGITYVHSSLAWMVQRSMSLLLGFSDDRTDKSRCGDAGNLPAGGIISVNAGSKV